MILEVADLHTYYGNSYVLQGVSLTVSRGQVVAILGRNGMGKTTLIRSIVGFTLPRRGRVVFKEREVTGWPSNRIVGLGLGLVPQGRRVFTSLTVAENLEVAVRGNGGPWSVDRAMALFPRLRARAENRAGKLSGGEQRQLEIALALAGSPRLLLLDEPTAGLSPAESQLMVALLKRLDRNITILIIEHDMDVAFEVTDRITVLHYGRVVADGFADEVKANPLVQEIYLGAGERL